MMGCSTIIVLFHNFEIKGTHTKISQGQRSTTCNPEKNQNQVMEGGCGLSSKRETVFSSVDISHCIVLPRDK